MTVQPSQGHEPGDTPPEELDRLIGAAAEAARELVGSRPSDRAGWLEHLATRLDTAAEELVPLAAQETHLGLGRLQGELKRTTFQLRLFAEILRDGSFLQATIDHADPVWPMGARPDLRRMLRPIGPGCGVCGEQLSVRVQRGRWRHRLGPGRWLLGAAEGEPESPGAVLGDGGARVRCAG